MKFIATVSNSTQKYDVHLEVADDDAGRARVAAALHEIHEQFLPRGAQPKKPAAHPATPPRPQPQPSPTGEAHREK
jgi:hypothetical protein